MGLSQEEFALRAGFDRGYMSGLERGVRNPSVRVLERIAHSFHIDVSEFFDFSKAEEFKSARSEGK